MAMALAPAISRAQGALSPETAIALSGGNGGVTKNAIGTGTELSAFVSIDGSKTTWDKLGLKPLTVVGNTATVRLTAAELKDLAAMDGVEYIQLTNGVKQTLDKAREETGTDDVHKGTSLPKPYTGKGVVFGVVDGGFDYMHAAFRNPTDGTTRIKRVWEQGTKSFTGAKAPEKFGYGIEMTTQSQLEAAQADITGNSHGSHVACIAAGCDESNNSAYIGNAPDADIVLVAMDLTNGTSVDICNGVQYIFDYADEVGKPCVVNLSLANNLGPHDGTSTFDVMTDAMQKPGHLIVGAANNARTDKFHIDHAFASADDAPLKTFINYKSTPSATSYGGSIDIWGDKGSDFTVEVAAFNMFSKEVKKSTVVYPAQEGVTEATFGSYAKGSIKVAAESASELNGKLHINLSSAVTSLRNNYNIAIIVTPKGKGRVNLWADNGWLGLSSKDVEGFSDPDEQSSTIGEIGGTGKKILTVGSYTTRNEFRTDTQYATLDEPLGAISSFSSYGPTADGRLKPEVSAPGCLIISASSNFDSGQVIAGTYEKFGRSNSYCFMQGTSMASPFVAGVVATWLEAYPTLSPEELKDIIMTTSRKDTNTTDEPNNDYGYGKINPMDGLKKCIDLQTAGVKTIDNVFDGSVKVVDGNICIAFPKAAKAEVSVADMSGKTVMQKSLGTVNGGEVVSVPMGQLANGIYVVSVRTAKTTKAFKVCL